MRTLKWGGAPPIETPPVVMLLGGNGSDTTSFGLGGQSCLALTASRLGEAIRDTLADVRPQERPELLQWIAARRLLGLGHANGCGAAAYRMADTLSGGPQ